MKEVKFESLIGQTFSEVVKVEDEQIVFTTTDGRVFRLHHVDECCESVYIESITGDLSDLVGSPILVAEESTSDQAPEDFKHDYKHGSETWTFYKLATIKGYVDIRWFGSSNGYYSEDVDFEEVTQ